MSSPSGYLRVPLGAELTPQSVANAIEWALILAGRDSRGHAQTPEGQDGAVSERGQVLVLRTFDVTAGTFNYVALLVDV